MCGGGVERAEYGKTGRDAGLIRPFGYKEHDRDRAGPCVQRGEYGHGDDLLEYRQANRGAGTVGRKPRGIRDAPDCRPFQ